MAVEDLIAADSKAVHWMMRVKLPIDPSTMDPLAEGPAGDPGNEYLGDDSYQHTIFPVSVIGGVGPFKWEIISAVDAGGDPVVAYFKVTGTTIIETGGYTEYPAVRIFGCADNVTLTFEVTDIYTDASITFDKDVSRPSDLVWDEDNPKILARGMVVTVHVTGGTSPFTWELDGHEDFYFPGFPDPHYAITTDREIEVAAGADACGGVTVYCTDTCSEQVYGGLRSDLGSWDQCMESWSECGDCPVELEETTDLGRWKILIRCCPTENPSNGDDGIIGSVHTCSHTGETFTAVCGVCGEHFHTHEFVC